MAIETAPLKGYTQWLGNAFPEVGRPSLDHYVRFSWAELEPQLGVFNFEPLERQLRALPPGGRLAFGIEAVDTCCSNHKGTDVPTDLPAQLTKGFYMKADPGNGMKVDKVYVPDWNDPAYLAAWRDLFAAIGQRYDGDPRIAWVDLRGYGNWGEGHVAGAGAYPRSDFPYKDLATNTAGALPGLLESREAIVDAIAQGLPHTRLLALTDDTDILLYALRLPTRIPVGMRRDSYGSRHFSADFIRAVTNPADRDLILNRWRTAPFIAESYSGSLNFEVGPDGVLQQIRDFHVSVVGLQGGRTTPTAPEEWRRSLLAVGALTGYNYIPSVNQCRLEKRKGRVELEIAWENDGVAPAYEPWDATYVIKANGTPPVLIPSKIRLGDILPGTPHIVTEVFKLPDFERGKTYTVSLRVIDPARYRLPMPMATAGQDGDVPLVTINP